MNWHPKQTFFKGKSITVKYELNCKIYFAPKVLNIASENLRVFKRFKELRKSLEPSEFSFKYTAFI